MKLSVTALENTKKLSPMKPVLLISVLPMIANNNCNSEAGIFQENDDEIQQQY